MQSQLIVFIVVFGSLLSLHEVSAIPFVALRPTPPSRVIGDEDETNVIESVCQYSASARDDQYRDEERVICARPVQHCTSNGVMDMIADGLSLDEIARVTGSYPRNATTRIPYERRGIRRSSLDPSELVASFDEVRTRGVSDVDSWSWRPMFDLFHTLLGMDFLYRAYVLEMGAPDDAYAAMECDFIQWTGLDEEDSWWGHEMRRAKNNEFVQTIDNGGGFCSFTSETSSSSLSMVTTGYDMSRSCQLDARASYETGGSFDGADAGQYVFTIDTPALGFSETVHLHELLHLAQNAHRGRRLYMEHPDDGECCTVWFEHIGFVAHRDYQRRLPDRFRGLDTWPPWHGWKLSEDENFRMPSWARIDYPDPLSESAEDPRWHTATFVQSAYRLYLAKQRGGDGTSFDNHALKHFTCLVDDSCSREHDGEAYKNSLDPGSDRDHFESFYGDNTWAVVGDNTYKLKNLATIWFVHQADLEHMADGGFGAFEFFTYELEAKRIEVEGEWYPPFMGAAFPSDKEMFSLAGYAGRREFLDAFHEWMVANIRNQRSPLQVADEITQPRERLLADIARLKARSFSFIDPDNTPRCMDSPLPCPPWYREEE